MQRAWPAHIFPGLEHPTYPFLTPLPPVKPTNSHPAFNTQLSNQLWKFSRLPGESRSLSSDIPDIFFFSILKNFEHKKVKSIKPTELISGTILSSLLQIFFVKRSVTEKRESLPFPLWAQLLGLRRPPQVWTWEALRHCNMSLPVSHRWYRVVVFITIKFSLMLLFCNFLYLPYYFWDLWGYIFLIHVYQLYWGIIYKT